MVDENTMREEIEEITQNFGNSYSLRIEALEKAAEWTGMSNKKRYYCRIEWENHLYELCSSFLGECVPRLWRLGGPEDVRVVFWFDS
jgi:hypothetical protein